MINLIRRAAEMRVEVREKMRGGEGQVNIRHCFEKNEMMSNTRLCSVLTLRPGHGIGMHPHEKEEEVFIITRGAGLVDDGKTQTPVSAGDAILTGNGAAHAIRNNGKEVLEIVAVILCYGPRS